MRRLILAAFILLVPSLAHAAAALQNCNQQGGYPWTQGACMNAPDINNAIDMSIAGSPPQNDFGIGARQGHPWLDTSHVPAVLRLCTNPAGCAVGYTAADWATLCTINLSTREVSCPTLPSNLAYTNIAQSFTAAQREKPCYQPTIGGGNCVIPYAAGVLTPNFDTAQNFYWTLVAADCPCTLANPSTTLVPGQSGIFKIKQSATGADLITIYGSSYLTAGGTAAITLSTAANSVDYLPYYVDITGRIILLPIVSSPTH
jgi:hypothetical protein